VQIASHVKAFKTIALTIALFFFASLSSVLSTEPLFEGLNLAENGDSSKAPSSLSSLPKELAFSRDTTFDALLKQELDTAKMCFSLISTAILSVFMFLFFSKIKYIHHTKMFRLLI